MSSPALHPGTHGHPKAGGSTPGTCCWGAAESRDQQGAQILPRAPLCLSSMPIAGGHQHPATLLGMAWPASVSRVRRTGGTAPILTTVSCRLVIKSLRRTMGPVNPFTMGLIANQTDFTLAVPLAMRLREGGLLVGWGVRKAPWVPTAPTILPIPVPGPVTRQESSRWSLEWNWGLPGWQTLGQGLAWAPASSSTRAEQGLGLPAAPGSPGAASRPCQNIPYPSAGL